MKTTVKIEGLRELDAALGDLLSEFGKSAATGAVRRSLLKSLEPMAGTARALAPDDPATQTRDLKASITTGTVAQLTKRQQREARRAHKASGAVVTVYMGTADPAGLQQEFGNVNHGPQPFMRPAFDRHAESTIRSVGKLLGPEIEKTAERIAKQRAKKAAKNA